MIVRPAAVDLTHAGVRDRRRYDFISGGGPALIADRLLRAQLLAELVLALGLLVSLVIYVARRPRRLRRWTRTRPPQTGPGSGETGGR